MTYSLNEVEAMAKRATRGAGYPWGLAEEAGRATRWLCSHGFDGVDELVQLLECGFANAAEHHKIETPGEDWQGAQTLCPMMTGATLSDFGWLVENKELAIQDVAVPALLVPFAANIASRIGQPIRIECDNGASVTTDGAGLACVADFPAHAKRVTVSTTSSFTANYQPLTRAEPDAQAWARLNEYAKRTYAPATEASRLLGAGAGLSDND